jgi:protein-disulfide isomerase
MTLHTVRRVLVSVAALGAIYGCAPDVRDGDAAAVAPGDSTAATPQDPRVTAADLARIKGDSSALIWFVMASDFQCPACKYWHENVAAEIERDYVATGKVRFAYLNFPLSQHRNARPASEAAMCAGAQGKFWEMHDRIFATQDAWSPLVDPAAHLRGLATAVAVDMALWDACMADDVMLSMIDSDFGRGNAGGVGETPTFFIGTQVIGGAVPASRLRPMIEAAIAQAGSGNP